MEHQVKIMSSQYPVCASDAEFHPQEEPLEEGPGGFSYTH